VYGWTLDGSPACSVQGDYADCNSHHLEIVRVRLLKSNLDVTESFDFPALLGMVGIIDNLQYALELVN
jgi:hypothetical protein